MPMVPRDPGRPPSARVVFRIMVRLQKFLADAGVASRREAEKLIVAGRIRVDGKVVQTLGSRVDPAKAEVSVDDTPVRVRRKIYIALNKPPGFLCTRRDPGVRGCCS